MKLRTTYNSIRIRIRKSELALLHRQGKIEEQILFPASGQLRFALQIADIEQIMDASLVEHMLTLTISLPVAESWINSNQVSIETHLPLPDGEPHRVGDVLQVDELRPRRDGVPCCARQGTRRGR